MANDSLSEISTPLLSKTAEPEEKPPSKPETVKPAKTVLKFEDVGVWTVMREVNATASWRLPGREMVAQGRQILVLFPIVYHFLQECFCVSPSMTFVYLLSVSWSSTEVRPILPSLSVV